jgi:hypothetical protein
VSAAVIEQKLRATGYQGGHSILREYNRSILYRRWARHSSAVGGTAERSSRSVAALPIASSGLEGGGGNWAAVSTRPSCPGDSPGLPKRHRRSNHEWLSAGRIRICTGAPKKSA